MIAISCSFLVVLFSNLFYSLLHFRFTNKPAFVERSFVVAVRDSCWVFLLASRRQLIVSFRVAVRHSSSRFIVGVLFVLLLFLFCCCFCCWQPRAVHRSVHESDSKGKTCRSRP